VKISETIASEFIRAGGTININSTVCNIEENDIEITVSTASESWRSSFLVCCAGLQADQLVKLHGIKKDFQIIPFRGKYYRLPEHKKKLFLI
jgi:L-2-hydroxyglutarate oxidase